MPLKLTEREVKTLLLGLGYVGCSKSEWADDARNLVQLLKDNPDCRIWMIHEKEIIR